MDTVTQETFRRLPLVVRNWYASRARMGMPLPTELAVRCLVNDFLATKHQRSGYKSTDGWKIKHAGARISALTGRVTTGRYPLQEAS